MIVQLNRSIKYQIQDKKIANSNETQLYYQKCIKHVLTFTGVLDKHKPFSYTILNQLPDRKY